MVPVQSALKPATSVQAALIVVAIGFGAFLFEGYDLIV